MAAGWNVFVFAAAYKLRWKQEFWSFSNKKKEDLIKKLTVNVFLSVLLDFKKTFRFLHSVKVM